MTVAPEMDEQSLFRYLCSASHWQFFILSKCMPQPDGSYLYNISYLLFYLKVAHFLTLPLYSQLVFCFPFFCASPVFIQLSFSSYLQLFSLQLPDGLVSLFKLFMLLSLLLWIFPCAYDIQNCLSDYDLCLLPHCPPPSLCIASFGLSVWILNFVLRESCIWNVLATLVALKHGIGDRKLGWQSQSHTSWKVRSPSVPVCTPSWSPMHQWECECQIESA